MQCEQSGCVFEVEFRPLGYDQALLAYIFLNNNFSTVNIISSKKINMIIYFQMSYILFSVLKIKNNHIQLVS